MIFIAPSILALNVANFDLEWMNRLKHGLGLSCRNDYTWIEAFVCGDHATENVIK